MSESVAMTENHQAEGRVLLPHILKLSEVLSKCTPHAWEARRYLYCTLFVRAAIAKKYAVAPIIEEFEALMNDNPLTLFQLLPDLVDLFGDTSDQDWSSIRSEIRWFYQVHSNQPGPSIYGAKQAIPKSFRPLPALYHSVEGDISLFNLRKEERLHASKELADELHQFERNNTRTQCRIPKKYVTLAKLADPECVWKVKQETFKMIFQRTRELFLFQDEEAHFHHAAIILEFMHDKLRRRIKPDTRKDLVAYKKHAKWLETFQRIYVGILEKTQKCIDMDEMIKFVTEKKGVSRQFQRVRDAASKDFQHSKKLLGDDDHVLPGLVDARASLASALYKKIRERNIAHDGLAHVTEKIKIQLLQLQAWQNLTGTSMIWNADAVTGDAVAPLGGEGASHLQEDGPNLREDGAPNLQDDVAPNLQEDVAPTVQEDGLISDERGALLALRDALVAAGGDTLDSLQLEQVDDIFPLQEDGGLQALLEGVQAQEEEPQTEES